jgi:hypothetical protein
VQRKRLDHRSSSRKAPPGFSSPPHRSHLLSNAAESLPSSDFGNSDTF